MRSGAKRESVEDGRPESKVGKIGESSAPRRQHQRQELSLDVSLYSDSNFYAGLTENLSAGGVFVATHVLRPVGEEMTVTIVLPTDEKVVARGVVRWVRLYNEKSDSPPGLGIQFLNVENESAMKAFLEARAPLFHDD